MKLIKIAEAMQKSGMVIEGVEGTLAAIYAPKTGEKEGKPWTRQDGTIKDETGEIRISIWDGEEISMLMKGKRLILQSTDGRHGKTGVKVKNNTYNGKTTAQLSVTGSAKVWFPDVQDAPHEESSIVKGPATGPVGGPAGLAGGMGIKGPAAKLDASMTASYRVAQYRMMYEICYKEAVTFTTKADLEGLEDTRQVATSFFINAVREGLDRGLTVKAEKEDEDMIPM